MSRQSEMKSVVEGIVASLAQKGINVSEAAVLSLDNLKNPADANKAIQEAFEKLGFGGQRPFKPAPTQEEIKNAQEQIAKANQEKEEGPCFCPNCFNFESFEEVLNTRPGAQFDYQTVTLLGKKFDIKFYNGPYGERMMVSPQDFKIDPSWSVETLTEMLNNAVAQKEFSKAQILLNELNNRKTN